MSNILYNKLPYLYEGSEEVRSIQDAIDSERLILTGKFEDFYKQAFVESAGWSLPMWEHMLGIKKLSDGYEARRENIFAKLRSTGVSSKKSLERLCHSFSGGDVKIIEDNPNYSFMVKFVSKQSIPANLDGLTRALEEVKPAHLHWDYIMAYNIWLQAKSMTWELSSQTWGEDKTSDFIEDDIRAICSNNTLASTGLICGVGV